MPVRMLSDRLIKPTEYTKWRHAEQRFARRNEDRKIMAQLKEAILRDGLREPIELGISERYPTDVYVADGHHRAVALMQLGADEFPFHWYWINNRGVLWETGPFPFHTLGL
ncbi:ParB N-terminal domain-containing protein [Streptomyces sp. NPDC096310]|uniref:ParB N-terminal domain-containing protein n=1 Tax=Streptomyces sp. NPDC096310 TaxID=3366082 RepID=UPI003825586B